MNQCAITRKNAPQVTLPPDGELLEHLIAHGVSVDPGAATDEAGRLRHAFAVQVLRYTFPFVFISALFWFLHTWVLDPVPNQFRRREFLRYRREVLFVGSKLNFRCGGLQAATLNCSGQRPIIRAWLY